MSRVKVAAIKSVTFPELESLSVVDPRGAVWTASADPSRPYRFCANWEQRGCNWLVEANAQQSFCLACQHNTTIPQIADPVQHALWVKIETAKRRLMYSLIKMRLPMPLRGTGDREPLDLI